VPLSTENEEIKQLKNVGFIVISVESKELFLVSPKAKSEKS